MGFDDEGGHLEVVLQEETKFARFEVMVAVRRNSLNLHDGNYRIGVFL